MQSRRLEEGEETQTRSRSRSRSRSRPTTSTTGTGGGNQVDLRFYDSATGSLSITIRHRRPMEGEQVEQGVGMMERDVQQEGSVRDVELPPALSQTLLEYLTGWFAKDASAPVSATSREQLGPGDQQESNWGQILQMMSWSAPGTGTGGGASARVVPAGDVHRVGLQQSPPGGTGRGASAPPPVPPPRNMLPAHRQQSPERSTSRSPRADRDSTRGGANARIPPRNVPSTSLQQSSDRSRSGSPRNRTCGVEGLKLVKLVMSKAVLSSGNLMEIMCTGVNYLVICLLATISSTSSLQEWAGKVGSGLLQAVRALRQADQENIIPVQDFAVVSLTDQEIAKLEKACLGYMRGVENVLGAALEHVGRGDLFWQVITESGTRGAGEWKLLPIKAIARCVICTC